jgi:outer membrane protein OmpA-like peptidoglycan-associated protein
MMRRTLLGTIPALLALAACAPDPTQSSFFREAGLGTGDGFGAATANNLGIQSGQLSYAVALSQRFRESVPTTINFAFNSAQLDGPARAILDRQADFILQFPEVRFAVYGHTDLVGSDAYNQRLGLRRAQAALDYLVARGVSRNRLQALVSEGETMPIVATQAPERANRRTVTDVTGFVESRPGELDGNYAAIIYRDYVASAGVPETTQGIEGTEVQVGE